MPFLILKGKTVDRDFPGVYDVDCGGNGCRTTATIAYLLHFGSRALRKIHAMGYYTDRS